MASRQTSKVKNGAEKRSSGVEITSTHLKSQRYHLGISGFVQLLGGLALFPFSSTEQLLALTGADTGTTLSLNRAQSYLRKARVWGWVGSVTGYDNNPASPGLTALATPLDEYDLYPSKASLNQVGKQPSPGVSEELNISSASDRKNVSEQKSGVKKFYYSYLTPAGARVLAHQVQLCLGKRTGAAGETLGQPRLYMWTDRFLQRFSFEEAKVLPYAGRLGSLTAVRYFLLALSQGTNFQGTNPREGEIGNSTTPKRIVLPGEIWWQDYTSNRLSNPVENEVLLSERPDLVYSDYFDAMALIKLAPSPIRSDFVRRNSQPINSPNSFLNPDEPTIDSNFQVLLVVADNEQLPSTWISRYLRKLLPQLQKPEVCSRFVFSLNSSKIIRQRQISEAGAEYYLDILARLSGLYNFTHANNENGNPLFNSTIRPRQVEKAEGELFSLSSGWAGKIRAVTHTSELKTISPLPIQPGLVPGEDRFVGEVSTFSHPPQYNSTAPYFDVSARMQIKLVVLTTTQSRADLWKHLTSQLSNEFDIAPLLLNSFTLQNLTNGRVQNILNSGLEVTINMQPANFMEQVQTCSSIISTDASDKSQWHNETENLVKGALPGSPNTLRYESKTFQPGCFIEGISSSGVEESTDFRSEIRLLLSSLLVQPTKRKLLYTLHAFGPLDLLALSRLSRVEMTHLTSQLKELVEAGLVARMWAADAQTFRSKENHLQNGQRLVPCAYFPPLIAPVMPVSSSRSASPTRVPFPHNYSPGPTIRQNYGYIGQKIRMVEEGETAAPGSFLYENGVVRMQRFLYFMTEAGLAVLEWLVGVPLKFDSRYQREIGRYSRLRQEVVAGERQVITVRERVGKDMQVYPVNKFSEKEADKIDNFYYYKPITSKLSYDIGFSWPTLMAEHTGAVNNFFLSLPSRHYFTPFSTATAIYTGKRKQKVDNSFQTFPDQHQLVFPFWDTELVSKAVTATGWISLEGWQSEPYCHQFFLSPEKLALAASWDEVSVAPVLSPRLLATLAGGVGGECLPDGYGEVLLGEPGKTERILYFYLEYERGQRNWMQRYLGKIAAYICMLWSKWLGASVTAGKPLPNAGKPYRLLVVATDEKLEQQLADLFGLGSLGITSQLWWEAFYKGYGPGGALRPVSPAHLAEIIAWKFQRFLDWAKVVSSKSSEIEPILNLGQLDLIQVRLRSLAAAFNYISGNKKFYQELLAPHLEPYFEINSGNPASSSIRNDQLSPQFPVLGLDIFSTNDNLLLSEGPTGQVWKQVYTPWSKINTSQNGSRLFFTEL